MEEYARNIVVSDIVRWDERLIVTEDHDQDVVYDH